jgi:ubiquinone/menaquinone biosynthesis C-methylase UbiE
MKVALSSLFRKIGALQFFDTLRFYLLFIRTIKSRNTFKQNNPDIKLPPDYLLYESYKLNYEKYYFEGKETAQWLVNTISKHTELSGKNILDWGCGPARIVRHLPEILDGKCHIYGTDYNSKTIDWCKENISNVSFYKNGIEASLDFENNFFDVIYGISIFTHLSEEKHHQWFKELLRVTTPGGILFLTTHGKSFLRLLNTQEQGIFTNGDIVIKGNTLEGHRTYAAFHPQTFFRKLIGDNEIVAFIGGKKYEQDIWIIKKK